MCLFKPRECIIDRFLGPNLKAHLDQFHKLVGFFFEMVLLTSSVSDRVAIIEKVLEIGEVCYPPAASQCFNH